MRSRTPIAIGNETDMLHQLNVDYLINLLAEINTSQIDNPIVLITKAPLSHRILERLRAISCIRLVFFLSYSGLDQRFEPNFNQEQLRANFSLAKAYDFPVIHYWRPLLPDNSRLDAVRDMLSFVSSVADATVFIGLKIHPALTPIITESSIAVPSHLMDHAGEWVETDTIDQIYREALRLCPDYPLYRHASCALASVLGQPNHTATVYRDDVCLPSHCRSAQRAICKAARRIPSGVEIANVLSVIGAGIGFERKSDRILIKGEVTQEEFAFLLHNLNCPLEATTVKMQNLYHGDIYKGQNIVE